MSLLLLSVFGLLFTSLVCPFSLVWGLIIFLSCFVLFFSFFLFGSDIFVLNSLSYVFGMDFVSISLVVLSCWLLPLTLLASQGHMTFFNINSQRIYCVLLILVLISLIITFSSLELSLFYISFETTLIPILLIISCWGSQYDRYQASVYFVFYTLFGSLPFLISLLIINNYLGSLFFPICNYFFIFENLLNSFSSLWWGFTFLIFIVKMPVYGFHLWLPKAHVEATVAGSMLLAAVLLKLGGYGLIRLLNLFNFININLNFFVVCFCLWGSLVTGIICFCQSDLKSLVAYSSVGHMSLVAGGIFLGLNSSVNGSMVLMISHGLVSSGLFCLANVLYERSGTRTLGLMRGYKCLMGLMAFWWLVSCAANLGLPPLPNLVGELLIITSFGFFDFFFVIVSGGSVVVSAIYSLLIYQFTQSNKLINNFSNVLEVSSREHLLLFSHLIPLFLLIINPQLLFIYF
uniref:NADH dehydrogenase subunit 4 n=1 Tax=Comanthus parvicirrus TaxID=1529418 RepID=UPI001EDE4D1D|nr:NADH dehydrogenase subunit 4 [Comanthus parvicirrus]UFQ22713.1 NADH dehydrogenase subunit 4 [Comanthus parvicirrus]UHY39308.1 NADH dehydrogenase subunit 4 [Comanthus parvicirrus]